MANTRPPISLLSSPSLRTSRMPSTLLPRHHPSPLRTTTRAASSSSSSSSPSPSPTSLPPSPPSPSPRSTGPRKIHPLIPPPTTTSGPLLTRLPNRALPDVTPPRTWLKTLPLFVALLTASSLAIFNYQKSSSSTVNAVLYALRTHPDVRAVLGDEIYFAAQVPWIRGRLNQLHGVIDIRFWVKGTKGQGETKFVSVRKRRDGYFETLEWSLKMEDGRVVQLLGGEGVRDPMASVVKE